MAKEASYKSMHQGFMEETPEGTRDPKTASLPSHLKLSPLLALNSLQTNNKDIQQPLVLILHKMEPMVRDMQHVGLGLRAKAKPKVKLISSSSSIPSFAGCDIITWLMNYHSMLSRGEATNYASTLCQFGYLYPVDGTSPCCCVRDDSTIYRFQDMTLWISHSPKYSDFSYAVYLLRKLLMSKHRVRLDEYELERLKRMKLKLSSRWEEVVHLAEEDQKMLKDQRKNIRLLAESQEAAFWHIWRPPPDHPSLMDKLLAKNGIKLQSLGKDQRAVDLNTMEEELKLLKKAKLRPKIYTSTALNCLIKGCCSYTEYDPLLVTPTLGNPWTTNSAAHWTKLETVQSASDTRDLRLWAHTLEELMQDVTGRHVFEEFCMMQHCSENIRFWQACLDLHRIPLAQVPESVNLIYKEFLSSTAESAVNVSADVRKQLKADTANPQRFSFSSGQKQVLDMMRKDIYPRFLRSEAYRQRFTSEQPQTLGKKFLDIFKRPAKTGSDPNQSALSPLSPGRYSRTKVSVGKRHPMNRQQASTSAEDLSKSNAEEDDNPFSADFIEALTMMQRGRIDSVAGLGTLPRRHSFSHMESVDELEEGGDGGSRGSVATGDSPDHKPEEVKRSAAAGKGLVQFTRKRSMSLGELPQEGEDSPSSTESRRRHASGSNLQMPGGGGRSQHEVSPLSDSVMCSSSPNSSPEVCQLQHSFKQQPVAKSMESFTATVDFSSSKPIVRITSPENLPPDSH